MPRTPIEFETLTLTEAPPLALGHRGARLQAPENTLTSFELALQHGCDGFECDLRLTADGRAVLCHDAEFLGLSVEHSDYASLLAKGRENGRNRAPDGEVLPRLEDLISRFASRAFVNLELKIAGMAEVVMNALRGCGRERILVSSFLPQALAEVRRCDPSLVLGWICDERSQLHNWAQIDCEVLIAHCPLVSPELVETIHSDDGRVLVWAAEQEKEIRELAEMGVDGIISAHTELLVRTLKRPKARAAALGR